jgi:hypothetical protein
MILRVLAHSVGVVLLAAVVGAVADPAIVRAAVEHITDGLEELVVIGERLGQSETGRQIAGQFSEQARRATQ